MTRYGGDFGYGWGRGAPWDARFTRGRERGAGNFAGRFAPRAYGGYRDPRWSVPSRGRSPGYGDLPAPPRPRRSRPGGYRGPGTDLGEDIARGYVGRGLYSRYDVHDPRYGTDRRFGR